MLDHENKMMEKFRLEREKNTKVSNRTFTMIKPEAVAANHIGGILKMIEEGGFRDCCYEESTIVARAQSCCILCSS